MGLLYNIAIDAYDLGKNKKEINLSIWWCSYSWEIALTHFIFSKNPLFHDVILGGINATHKEQLMCHHNLVMMMNALHCWQEHALSIMDGLGEMKVGTRLCKELNAKYSQGDGVSHGSDDDWPQHDV